MVARLSEDRRCWHHSGCSLRVTLQCRASPQGLSLCPPHSDCLACAISDQVCQNRLELLCEGELCFLSCPFLRDEPGQHCPHCCACLVSAALTLLSSPALCSQLPAWGLACAREHRVALQVSQLAAGFPWGCAAPGLACPSLSLQCTLTSLLLMQLAATAVQTAWLGCTSLTAQAFGWLGFFPLRAVCINWFYYCQSAVFKKDIIP